MRKASVRFVRIRKVLDKCTDYFSTQGCRRFDSSLAVDLEDEPPFAAACFAAAARALLSKKLAIARDSAKRSGSD